MTEEEIRKLYSQDKSYLEAFGLFVTKTIHNRLLDNFGSEEKVDEFLKIPIRHRVKDINSLISKALYRGKNYKNPYSEITDKVGIRLVVLLTSQIKNISSIVESIDYWNYSLDRNYEDERLANPKIFDYQSVHYVVTLREAFQFNGITIPKGATCEIQIKTLLQHAYSELTHDTVYKPKFRAEPSIVRHVSKSMALIETTDEIFERVYIELTATYKKMSEFFDHLILLYNEIHGSNIEEKMNYFIIDTFYSTIKDISIESIKKFYNDRKYLHELIKQRCSTSLLFQQPVIILIYYLANSHQHILKKNWPLTESELDPIFADLGISNSLD